MPNPRKPQTFYTLEIYPLYGIFHIQLQECTNVRLCKYSKPCIPVVNVIIMCINELPRNSYMIFVSAYNSEKTPLSSIWLQE